MSVIDDLSNGRRENIAAVADQISFVEGSILDDAKLRQAMRGADIVFHEAAIASVPRSVKEPALYFRVNAEGTLRTLEAARELKVRADIPGFRSVRRYFDIKGRLVLVAVTLHPGHLFSYFSKYERIDPSVRI